MMCASCRKTPVHAERTSLSTTSTVGLVSVRSSCTEDVWGMPTDSTLWGTAGVDVEAVTSAVSPRILVLVRPLYQDGGTTAVQTNVRDSPMEAVREMPTTLKHWTSVVSSVGEDRHIKVYISLNNIQSLHRRVSRNKCTL